MHKRILILITAILAILLLPYIGARIHFHGDFPTSYFDYPPLTVTPKAGFSLTLFIIIAITFLIVALVYLVPKLFGFKKSEVDVVDQEKKPFPIWFWAGLIMWGVTLLVLWTKMSEPKWLLNWADLPLFWGFTLVLDGIVYRRTGGNSIIGRNPRGIMGIGIASVSGWLLFEFLNFFVNDNWIYPSGDLIPINEFVLYAFLGSSGLLPMAFEWYSLLTSFPKLRERFSHGINLKLPKFLTTALLIICFTGLFLSGFLPNDLFFILWLAPVIILSILLERMDIWTPFTPIKSGNWGPMLLFALTYLIQGLLLECWNFFSGIHSGGHMVSTETPAYWVYSIPYVDVLHVFEMPLLGLLGYLPFGVYCWVWWIAFAYLMDIPSAYRVHPHKN